MKKPMALTLTLALLISALVGAMSVNLVKANPFVTPDIWVNSPQNRKVYSSSEVELIFVAPAVIDSNINFTSFSYSLDGQAKVAIAGNTTLTHLSWGSHSLVVYGTDAAGNVRVSWEIYFDIVYSTKWAAIAIVILVPVVFIGLLVRKRLVMAVRGKKTFVFWVGLAVFLFFAALTSIESMGLISKYFYPLPYPDGMVFYSDVLYFVVGISLMLMGLYAMKSGMKTNQSPQTTNSQK